MPSYTKAQAQDALSLFSDLVASMPDDVTQPPPPPPIQSRPDLPAAPVGPFTPRSAFTVAEKHIVTNADGKRILRIAKAAFANNYIAVRHDKDTSPDFDELYMGDIVADNVGSLWYGAYGKKIGKSLFERLACRNVKSGRPFLMLHGYLGPVVVNDLDLLFDPTPNTMTGNIAEGIQCGSHPGDGPEDIESLTVNRMRVGGINTKWPDGDYWNGDGAAIEGSVRKAILNHITISGVTDGGLDVKCPADIGFLFVEKARAGYKGWADTTIARLLVIDPQIQGGIGGASVLRLQGPKPGSGKKPPTFEMPDVDATISPDYPASLVMVNDGPILFHGKGKYDGPALVRKGNGGSLLPGSTWNGEAIP